MSIKLEHAYLATGQARDHRFTSKVLNASVEMSEFDLKYDGDDHHVLDVDATASIVSVSGPTVTVRVTGQIKDQSGNSGGGTVGYLLIAETE